MSHSIHVAVTTKHLKMQSQPHKNRFVYEYTITISNQGSQIAQLISRYWHIEDANGKVQEVEGPGVVGMQPFLQPGSSYTYSSGAIIETETGIMQGNYFMQLEDGQDIKVPIPAFALVPPHAIH